MENNNEEKTTWLDNSDVMRRFNCSSSKLYLMRRSGQLPYTKFGGKILYNEKDIENLLNSNYKNK